MFDNIENLKLVYSTHGISKPHQNSILRKSHVFNFRISESMLFKIDDRSITVSEGQMLFIPQGYSYTIEAVSKKDSQFTTVSFQADLKDPEPKVYSLENFSEANFFYNYFTDYWNFGNQSEKYKCISAFYSLLSYLSHLEHLDYADKKKLKIIEPAVNYLKSHMFDCSLKIDCLHSLCGVSDTYFRKIFISNFGMSPRQYVQSIRMNQAKSIMDNQDFDTIGEIAESVGYKDPLYFSRVFKNKYGISPSNINKQA